jgi:ATP-dependent Clp protease ATP-binding subunit ClpC
MFQRFTDRSRRVLVLAQEEARNLSHVFIGTEHLLLGLIGEGSGIAARALSSLGVTLDDARTRVLEIVGPHPEQTHGSPPFTPRAKRVLELSLREALEMGHSYIGTEHLLLGVAREGGGVAMQVLVDLDADAQKVRAVVMEMMRESASRAAEGAGGQDPPLADSPEAYVAGAVRAMGRRLRGDLDSREFEENADRISRDVLDLLLERWNAVLRPSESGLEPPSAAQ